MTQAYQRTLDALIELGEANANIIAEKTGRSRSVTSNYLNKLLQMEKVKCRTEKTENAWTRIYTPS